MEGARCESGNQVLIVLTLSSKMLTAMPESAPDPASPMKWPEPMLEAKRDAPTCDIVSGQRLRESEF